jgi:hypothetical protein
MKDFLSNEIRDNIRWALSFLFVVFLYFGLLFLSYRSTSITCFSISGVVFAAFLALDIGHWNQADNDLSKIKSFALFSLFSFFLFFLGTWLLSLAIPVFGPSWLKSGIAFGASLLLPLISFVGSAIRSKKHGHH